MFSFELSVYISLIHIYERLDIGSESHIGIKAISPRHEKQL